MIRYVDSNTPWLEGESQMPDYDKAYMECMQGFTVPHTPAMSITWFCSGPSKASHNTSMTSKYLLSSWLSIASCR